MLHTCVAILGEPSCENMVSGYQRKRKKLVVTELTIPGFAPAGRMPLWRNTTHHNGGLTGG